MIARALVVVGAAALFVPAHAAASPVTPQAEVDAAGEPLLSSWTSAATGTPVTWRSCPPGGTCVTLAETGYMLRPGSTPGGTQFQTSIVEPTGATRTWTSPTWLGRQANVTPPAVIGTPTVGETITVQPAAWSGGWSSATEVNEVLACATAAGEQCRVVTSSSAVLGAEHAQQYLFAWGGRAVWWHGNGPSRPDGPFSLPTPGASASVAGPYGPVAVAAPAIQEQTPVAEQAATATLRTRALRRGGRIVVGRVVCDSRCKVDLRVSDGRRTVKRSFTTQGSTALAVGKRLRHGRLKITVKLDGRPAVSGRVRLAR